MPGKHNAGGCSCCACFLWSDNFNRADSDTVTAWTEVSGDWDIDTNQLKQVAAANAIIIADQAPSRPSWYVNVRVLSTIANAIYRVIANYKDSSNFHFADFVFTATGFTISLYKKTAGSNSLLAAGSFDAAVDWTSADVELKICLWSELFFGRIDSAGNPSLIFKSVWVFAPTLHADAQQVGLGNGSALDIWYDDFLIEETDHTASTAAECPVCFCGCGPYQTLCATIHSTDCLAIDGKTFEFEFVPASYTWEPIDLVGEDCLFIKPGTLLECDATLHDIERCMGLKLTFYAPECVVSTALYPSSCDCDPLSVTFGPFTIDNGTPPLCACCDDGDTFTVEFTEGACA